MFAIKNPPKKTLKKNQKKSFYTIHSTLFVLHYSFYTIHSTLFILHYSFYTVTGHSKNTKKNGFDEFVKLGMISSNWASSKASSNWVSSNWAYTSSND